MRRLYALSLFSFFFAVAANAQLGSPAPWNSSGTNKQVQTLDASKTPGGSPSGSPVNAPVDSGLAVLIAAGVLYGYRAYRNHKKRSASVL